MAVSRSDALVLFGVTGENDRMAGGNPRIL
jgi:hypothetical protein